MTFISFRIKKYHIIFNIKSHINEKGFSNLFFLSIFLGDDWKSVSPEAKHMIKLMLEPDYMKRISSVKALNDKWITANTSSKRFLSAKCLQNLSAFHVIKNRFISNKNKNNLLYNLFTCILKHLYKKNIFRLIFFPKGIFFLKILFLNSLSYLFT